MVVVDYMDAVIGFVIGSMTVFECDVVQECFHRPMRRTTQTILTKIATDDGTVGDAPATVTGAARATADHPMIEPVQLTKDSWK